DGGEVHAVDRWINELPQVGLVDQPPPGAFAPRFGDHHDGVVLATWMRLTQPEPTGLNLSSKLSFALSWGPLQRGGPPWHISTREPVPMLSFGIAHRSHCQRWER